jgi:hypothetical protein
MSHRNGIVHGAALLGLLILGTAALPARADWLVTRDGGRVETKGTWQIKGKLVVFTRAADSALASLRASEVDLDASAKATADAKVKAEAPPPVEVPQKKIAVLTDKDFRKPAPPAEGDSPDKGAPAKSGPLAVSNWKKMDSPAGDGITIEGQIHNTGRELMINASVDVQLFNESGDRVGSAQGLLTSTSLQPDATASFRANFPGVFTFTEAKFQVNGQPLTVVPPGANGNAPAEQAPPP